MGAPSFPCIVLQGDLNDEMDLLRIQQLSAEAKRIFSSEKVTIVLHLGRWDTNG